MVVRVAPWRIALVCMLLAFTGTLDAGAAKRKRSCPRADTKTVARNGAVRLFVREGDANRTLHACLRKSRRTLKLVKNSDDDLYESAEYSNVRLAGYFVAWSYQRTDVSCKADCPPNYNATFESVQRFDLRTEGEKDVSAGVHGSALRLNRRGALGWTEEDIDGLFDVVAYDRADKRILDHGLVPTRSLRFSGRTLRWTNGGVERSATLD